MFSPRKPHVQYESAMSKKTVYNLILFGSCGAKMNNVEFMISMFKAFHL